MWSRLVLAFRNINWRTVGSFLITQLKGEVVKIALKKLLGSALIGGFKAWVVKFVVEYMYDELAEPIIRYGLRQAQYHYERVEGKVLIKRLKKADNEQDHNRTIRDILD